MTEDAEEVVRLKNEALLVDAMEENPPKNEYEMEEVKHPQASPEPTFNETESSPVTTSTRSNETDDSYLESLLAGLDDWDKI